MQALLESSRVVVGEIYPRAAYATALLDANWRAVEALFSTVSRPPLALAKGNADVRQQAIKALRGPDSWVHLMGVTIENLDDDTNEDDFDACVTAAALLRCALEKLPLCLPLLDSARAEGGRLGTGSVNLGLPEQTFGSLPRRDTASGRRTRHGANVLVVRDGTKRFRCPIPGCDKVYVNARGGWDSHVGSVGNHRPWHPELTSAEERKRQFEIEFRDFFS